MTTRGSGKNGRSQAKVTYRGLIEGCLANIKAIREDIVRKRLAGREVTLRIDRNLRTIQAVIDHLQATI